MDRGEGRLTLEVLTWNLFHGRDHPPGEMRGGISWRLLGRPVEGEEYVLLNRSLRREFSERIAGFSWDVALLQEVPVGWASSLAEASGAGGRIALTSRNWMSPLTGPVWSMRPHLAGSWEGGSNLILVRGGRKMVPGRSGSFTLRLRPERRRVHFVEIDDGPLVFNLHASTGATRASEDVLRAASFAAEEATGRPFVFGGDLNVRPRSAPAVFERMAEDHGLVLPAEADPRSIDQLLSTGQPGKGGGALPVELREGDDPETGLKVRLSDHAPVVAVFDI